MTRRQQAIYPSTPAGSDLPVSGLSVRLPHPGGSHPATTAGRGGADPTAITSSAPPIAAAEVQAMRQAFIRALAQQAARELAAQMFAQRDD